MKNNISQKGFAVYIFIAIVVVAIIVVGREYFYIQNQSKEAAQIETQEKEAMEKKENGPTLSSLTYAFVSQNNSGQTGTVTFSEVSKDVTVVAITTNDTPKDVPQPSHIHVGSCKTLGAPSHTLNNMVNGKSVTFLGISFEKLWKEVPFAVNVHKSSAEVSVYTACADITKEEAMMKEGEDMIKYSGAVLAGKSALLLDFTKADYDVAIASNRLVVLYFYANWCPICKAEFPKMQDAFNELNNEKVIGFRVNFNDNETDSNETALARQFNVNYQHTKVFFKNGQRVLKAPDSWDKNRYLNEINKAI